MRTIIIISLVLVLPAILIAQQTYVPDDNFEQALIDLGYDTPPLNDSVPTANIINVISFDIHKKNISDLTGIEEFVALEKLICHDNDITSLDMSNNLVLDSLVCYWNNIESLNISNNTALKTLICDENPLSSLDVSNNTHLEILSCSFNSLENLDLSKNTALKILGCSFNNLENLDLSKNTSLEELYCHDNDITSLDLSNNSNLKILYCYKNELSSIDLRKNTKLIILSCYKNNLPNLNVLNLDSLRSLSCEWNNLKHLDLNNNIALQTLFCHDNFLKSLDLSNNINLKRLYCNKNELISLDIKNDNNQNMSGYEFGVFLDATDNPDLFCMQVDDSAWSANHIKWVIDDHVHYSEDCGYTGIDFQVEDETDNISISSSPNPFSQSTMINYKLAKSGKVVLKVYDIFGNEVATLLNEFKDAGAHKAQFNAGNLPQGIYFYKIQIDNAIKSAHLLLIK